MKKFSPNNQIELCKPPVPKARPPLRSINVSEEINSFKNSKNLLVNMYKTKQQNQEFRSASDFQYTDDDDDDDDDDNDDNDDNDDKVDDDIEKNNYTFLNNSKDIIPECFNTSHNSTANQSFNITPQNSPSTIYRRNYHKSNACSNINKDSFSHKEQKQPVEGFFSNNFKLLLGIILCFLLLFVLLNIQTKSHKNPETIIETKKVNLTEINNILDKSIQIIQTRFHNQKSNIWNDISAGIYDVVLFPLKPSIIILFGNETKTLNCLAQSLGQLSGKILGSNDYLILTAKDFPNDVGQTIHNLKIQIIQKKAVIVQDLLSINTEALKAFHNFCDREKPLVEHAIYIITVIVDGYKSSQMELEFIEKQIFRRLSKYMDKDILDPLVTRLTDGIIVPIRSESNINFNYADCSI
ncbi:uncharacterized protein LOC107995227 isoform X1 [Apis cerana]|uniref:uncharacterized protein LOC107995227 isoform X1 n=1 Tax=Apis cerana TaxID=7461 RepID=UPI002B234F85|nr:uncharacterized protein LOC107995227 isoform X1 [Apis cerana]